MLDGFHIRIDAQGKLVQEISDGHSVSFTLTENIADKLIDYIDYDFSSLWSLICALRESAIFDAVIDIKYSDFEECKNGCELITEELSESEDQEIIIGACFIKRELDRINTISDDGSAGFWIYQARKMVDALELPIAAHTFISRAFEFIYASDCAMTEKIKRFFNAYPELRNHAFAQTFKFEVLGNTDFPVLKQEYYIRSYTELFFFCLLELIRQNIYICRCLCCGSYFVPKTKKKTLYCDRVIKDGKTCKETAPKLKRKIAEDGDSALKEYSRLRNLYKSRAERYENRTDLSRSRTPNDLTHDEFYLWSTQAVSERRRYIAGEITAEEFLRRIDKIEM